MQNSFSQWTDFKGPRGKDNYETIYVKLISLFIESKVHLNYYLAPIKKCLK